MEIISDIAIFVAQLLAFFSVMILAFLAYDFIITSVRRWMFGDEYDDLFSPKLRSGSASGKGGGCGCDEGECEWPFVCDEITKSEEDRYFKELKAMVDAQEKAEQEFWNNREVLVELWEPKEDA